MERILILGSAGSGKSTLARQLGERLQIEVIHLDRYWWRSGWQMTPQEVFLEKVLAFIEGERWIMDGNYLPSLPLRLAAADTAIFLDLPRLLCLWRVLLRYLKHRKVPRSDLPPGCPERLNWQFLKWIWLFPKVNRLTILKLLELAGRDKKVYIFRSSREVAEFLAKISSTGRKNH